MKALHIRNLPDERKQRRGELSSEEARAITEAIASLRHGARLMTCDNRLDRVAKTIRLDNP